jgi:D-alanine-D-alanine ligase
MIQATHNNVDAARFGRVGVLYGGQSAEREISLMSGIAVMSAMQRQGLNVIAIDVGHDIQDQLNELQLDCAFIALHGPGGEDGTIQRLLDVMHIPYTGSGVNASSLAMNKKLTKELWQRIGLPTTEFAVLREDMDWLQVLSDLGGEVMVKPATEGSSLGMASANTAQQLREAWSKAADYDAVVIAEPLLPGKEYTVAILGNQALPSICIEAKAEFYDYKAKYRSGDTAYHCPSGLSDNREQELQQLSLDAFNSLGCSGWGRVDIMLDSSNQFQLLEVNTVPGLTNHSLVPRAAAQFGLSFDDLITRILTGCGYE